MGLHQVFIVNNFKKNLKYNKENKEQRMHLDQKQIALIQHLINDHHLYQDEYLDIDKEINKAYIYLKYRSTLFITRK